MRTFKYRWSSAFGLSFLCHGIVLGAVAGLLFLFPPAQPSREPIEVDLVSDVGGGGGGGGGGQETEELPKIHEAKATPTAPPPAVPTEADEEAANDVHEVAQAQSTTSSSSAPADESASSSSEGGSGGGTGGGQGTGDGTGSGRKWRQRQRRRRNDRYPAFERSGASLPRISQKGRYIRHYGGGHDGFH